MTAREKLLTFITHYVNNETAAKILERLDQLLRNGYSITTAACTIASKWDESKHPRDEDGKFADGGGGRNTVARVIGNSDHDRVMRERQAEFETTLDEAARVFKKKPTKRTRDEDDETVTEHRRRAKEGRSLEDCRRRVKLAREAYEKAKKKRSPDTAERRDEWMEAKRETRRAEKNEREFKDASRRIRHYNELAADVEDEIDLIEEKYGVEPFKPLRFPESEEGDYDRDRLNKLLRERKRLDKITSAVFNDEDDDEEED